MNNRERFKAIMNYEAYDRLPILHFGFWRETLVKWWKEGHIKEDVIDRVFGCDGSAADLELSARLGFDYNYFTVYRNKARFSSLYPVFEEKVLEEFPDGHYKMLNEDGAIVLQKKDIRSIPAELGHTLVDRVSWEEHYVPRLMFSEERIDQDRLRKAVEDSDTRTEPLGIYCHSLFGQIRNFMGLVGISYLYADDEVLFDEMIGTVAEVAYQEVKYVLEAGAKFDFGHFWEDICFKNGPLISPEVFKEKVGPYYKRICDLLRSYDVNIVSLDCDGVIDLLIPVWLENGVNTMFPIEVGTWDASIKPWRELYGKELRGVGGMNKNVFAENYYAIDAEIERLKPLVDLGGYIPCPDHRIPPTAKWENVQYYCEKMRKAFG